MLGELRSLYEIQVQQPDFKGSVRLTEDDLQRWRVLLTVSRSELYDEIALHLARGFYNSELTFAFCDAVMNGIHGIITNADEERPERFWEIYLAFDEGEYYHGNNRQEDPVEAYTRPMIARILGQLS